MEDEEEYSYKGYAEKSEEKIATFKDNEEVFSYTAYADTDGDGISDEGEIAPFKDNEEVFSYTAYADAEVAGEERTESYGDYIIEEFSAETNVSRITKITKLPAHMVTYVFSAIYLVVGILCVAITEQITEWLPYIVGAMMIIIGFARFVVALYHHEYRHLKTNQTATSLIVTALGIMIVIQHFLPDNDSAITFISIVWGILGLFEGAHAFNHAFKRIANSERCVYYLIKGLIEVIVAFMLLYDPGNHSTHQFHIIVFGLIRIIYGPDDRFVCLPKLIYDFCIEQIEKELGQKRRTDGE